MAPPRPLLLNGFMASGKSTVGRLAAERLGVSFLDLDAEVQSTAGRSVAEIFQAEGEAGFRARERQELEKVLAMTEPCVVALGGGALLRRETRLRAVERAVVVTLAASLEETRQRAAADATARPLLQAGEEQLELLLEQRDVGYHEAHRYISTTGRTPEDLAADVADFYLRDTIGVADGLDSYSVDVGEGTSRLFREYVRSASRCILITDSNVGPLHAKRYEKALRTAGKTFTTITIPAGEANKNLTTLELIWQQCLAFGADRKSLIIALGGGVVTDIAGFAASGWMRGIPWIGIPTSLLSMVDASVGGKTAVDLGLAKNCIGAFHQPTHVYCDIDLLNTEPQRGFLSAVSEIVKSGLIGDPTILDLCESSPNGIIDRNPKLLEELVGRSIRVKASVVNRDAKESGIRATLNLGHTVGHALEAGAGYGVLTHGEAVSLGLVAALRIGEQLGVTPPALTQRVTQLLDRLELPTRANRAQLQGAAQLLTHDKKRAGGQVTLVLARSAGDVVLHPVNLADLERLTLSL